MKIKEFPKGSTGAEIVDDYMEREQEAMAKVHRRIITITKEELPLFFELTRKGASYYKEEGEINKKYFAIYLHDEAVGHRDENGEATMLLEYGCLKAMADILEEMAMKIYVHIEAPEGEEWNNLYLYHKRAEEGIKKKIIIDSLSDRAQQKADSILETIKNDVMQIRAEFYMRCLDAATQNEKYQKQLKKYEKTLKELGEE